jgi:hypothetical protein
VTRWIALAALSTVILQLARIVWIFYQLAVTDLTASNPDAKTTAEPIRAVGRRAKSG